MIVTVDHRSSGAAARADDDAAARTDDAAARPTGRHYPTGARGRRNAARGRASGCERIERYAAGSDYPGRGLGTARTGGERGHGEGKPQGIRT
jgi:hypothetical protein